MAGLWLSICWECHNPNWRTPSFFRGIQTTNQLEKEGSNPLFRAKNKLYLHRVSMACNFYWLTCFIHFSHQSQRCCHYGKVHQRSANVWLILGGSARNPYPRFVGGPRQQCHGETFRFGSLPWHRDIKSVSKSWRYTCCIAFLVYNWVIS